MSDIMPIYKSEQQRLQIENEDGTETIDWQGAEKDYREEKPVK